MPFINACRNKDNIFVAKQVQCWCFQHSGSCCWTRPCLWKQLPSFLSPYPRMFTAIFQEISRGGPARRSRWSLVTLEPADCPALALTGGPTSKYFPLLLCSQFSKFCHWASMMIAALLLIFISTVSPGEVILPDASAGVLCDLVLHWSSWRSSKDVDSTTKLS